jgi:Peptidase family M28/PA domain
MVYSGSGDITAPVVAVGYQRGVDPETAAEHPRGRGCAGDLPDDVRGTIVLVQAGACFRRAQVASAQERHAAAIVVAYPQWLPGFVLRPTLLTPDGIDIPVIGTTGALGDALADAADVGASVHLQVATRIQDQPVSNLIAETSGGDPNHVIVLGGHLDSALDGAGINDNGSGTMAIVEVARRLARLGAPPVRVRFAFWAGEELGIYGSRHYVDALSPSDRGKFQAYLNFDMLASPNGGRLVYQDSRGAAGSAGITSLFTGYFDSMRMSHEELDLSGASDQVEFAEAGIPTGGLFAGANDPKTPTEVQLFGGTAPELLDACYHRACDTQANVNRDLLDQMLRGIGYVTGELASGGVHVRP